MASAGHERTSCGRGALFYREQTPWHRGGTCRREESLVLISLPTTEIEGRRPADFPPTFRNQAGEPETPISIAQSLTVADQQGRARAEWATACPSPVPQPAWTGPRTGPRHRCEPRSGKRPQARWGRQGGADVTHRRLTELNAFRNSYSCNTNPGAAPSPSGIPHEPRPEQPDVLYTGVHSVSTHRHATGKVLR